MIDFYPAFGRHSLDILITVAMHCFAAKTKAFSKVTQQESFKLLSLLTANVIPLSIILLSVPTPVITYVEDKSLPPFRSQPPFK